MPFTIQDLAKFLINPLFPLFVLLFIQLFRKERGKRLLLLLCFYLYLVSIPATSKLIMPFWLVEDTFDSTQPYEAVIVLSGVSDSKWYLARGNEPVLLESYHRLNQNADRVITGAELLIKGQAQQLLIGDPHFDGFSEGQLVKEFLEAQGIPSEQIVVYAQIKNTLQEAQKVRSYLDEHGIKKIVLVTSATHMRRAGALFKKQELYPDYLSVLRPNTTLKWKDLIPEVDGMKDMSRLSYEVVGYIGYWMLGKI